jgi:predicted DCC family thiol-disulfide oxidoreductase YuxK
LTSRRIFTIKETGFYYFAEMKNKAIILFDGICNLCNGAVQFVIRHDQRDQFLFASLQSKEAEKVLEPFSLDPAASNSFILVDDGKVYFRSTGVLRVLKKLSGFWRVFYGFIIVPGFIRDSIYNLIARKRYRWFGKKDQCMIPTPELQSKFLHS